MKVWRIAKRRRAGSIEALLSGEGARLYGGRWTPRGVSAVYCAETASLAALEVIVHLADVAGFVGYSIVDLEIPEALIVEPAGSTTNPQRLGAELLRAHLAFRVPSAVNGLERVIVMNPEHPDRARVKPGRIRPFALDARLVR